MLLKYVQMLDLKYLFWFLIKIILTITGISAGALHNNISVFFNAVKVPGVVPGFQSYIPHQLQKHGRAQQRSSVDRS